MVQDENMDPNISNIQSNKMKSPLKQKKLSKSVKK